MTTDELEKEVERLRAALQKRGYMRAVVKVGIEANHYGADYAASIWPCGFAGKTFLRMAHTANEIVAEAWKVVDGLPAPEAVARNEAAEQIRQIVETHGPGILEGLGA